MSRENQEFFGRFQHKGAWWLPETPEKFVYGVLTHDEAETTLDLFGTLREVDMATRGLVAIPQPTAIIYGQLETGQRCTLYRNHNQSEKLNLFAGAAISSKWSSKFLFIGAHIENPDSFDFTRWTITYAGLEEWAGVHPFKPPDMKRKDGRLVEVASGYVAPPKFEVTIEALKAKLELDYMFGSSGSMFHSQLMEHFACFVLTPESPKGLDWYMDALRDVQNFLVLCIGEPVYPRTIEATGLRKVEEGQDKEAEIQVFYHYSHRKESEPAHTAHMLIQLGAIQHMLSQLLNGWFHKAGKLRNVHNLFFGTYYNEGMYLESLFLTLTQALETYSRSVTESLYVEESEYEKIAKALVEAIPATTPSDLKQSLKKRIQYGNEYSLRKRLNGLLNSLEPDTLKMICPDAERFRERLVHTRNYLTHYTDELKENAMRGLELYYANQRMQLLLIVLLLKEMGVSDEPSIRLKLLNNPRWIQVIYLHLAKDS